LRNRLKQIRQFPSEGNLWSAKSKWKKNTGRSKLRELDFSFVLELLSKKIII